MKKYHIWHIPILCFFSRSFYRDLAVNWKRGCFGYLFLLFALCFWPQAHSFIQEMNQAIPVHVSPVVNQIPEITIAGGKLSITNRMPYEIRSTKGELIAVIDTTGTIQTLNDTDAFILATKDTVYMRKSDMETRTYELAEIKEPVSVNAQDVHRWIKIGQRKLVPVVAVILFITLYVIRVIKALIYGLIGMIINAVSKRELGYMALVRIGAAAVTPAIIISTLLQLIHFTFPGMNMLLFGLTIGLMIFGVSSNEKTEAAKEPPQLEQA